MYTKLYIKENVLEHIIKKMEIITLYEEKKTQLVNAVLKVSYALYAQCLENILHEY